MVEIKYNDLIKMAGGNVYDTEYSHKLNISCKASTHRLFKELKKRFKDHGMRFNNAQLFELMVVELFNTNIKQYQ